MVAMTCMLSMRKLQRGKKDRLCLGFKNRILPQDEYEAKWYNWCDGFNQAATLLLKRKADEADQANR